MLSMRNMNAGDFDELTETIPEFAALAAAGRVDWHR